MTADIAPSPTHADANVEGGRGYTQQARNEYWTDAFPQLDKEMVSYESMISPTFYELEREAVFRRSWLFVGREENVATPGSYFTKEIDVLDTSLIIVQGKDGKIRAFHNTCPHRGNKLVWEGHPGREVLSGRCARFMCKYHGLGFALDGKIDLLVDADNWFGDQGTSMHLAEVPLQSWSGFLFVNFTPGGPKQSLEEYLGPELWNGLEGFPYKKLSRRNYFTGECKSNWKALQDAFSEAWHGMTLHWPAFPIFNASNMKFRSMHYALYGEHRHWVTGRMPPGSYNYDIERLTEAGPLGGDRIGPEDLSKLPPFVLPDQDAEWGTVTISIFPNFQLQFYYPGWFQTYTYWPKAHDEMHFEIDQHHQEPACFSEIFSQKGGLSIISDALGQDINTLEATQRGLKARAFDKYPLIDEEVQVRHFHQQIYKRVDAYKAELAQSGGVK